MHKLFFKKTFGATIKGALIRLDKILPIPLFYQLHTFKMTSDEITLFDETIKKSRYYLEFGLGGSTIRTLLKSNAMVFSVDSSSEWIDELREYSYIRMMENQRLKLFHVNIGPIRKWGHPVDKGINKEKFPYYSGYVFDQIKNVKLDTVLIDGRFRVACALKTIMEYSNKGNILLLIHNFWNRYHKYHVLLNYLVEVNRADKLSLFSIKKNVDLDSVKNNYEIYKYDPK